MKPSGHFAVTPSDLHAYPQLSNVLFYRQPHWQVELSAMTLSVIKSRSKTDVPKDLMEDP
jgi:hypothetical protein